MMVPTAEFPPMMPLALHVTPCAGLPVAEIEAMNVCAPPTGTLADAGETVTTMLSVRVTAEEPLAESLAMLTAVTLIVGVEGKV